MVKKTTFLSLLLLLLSCNDEAENANTVENDVTTQTLPDLNVEQQNDTTVGDHDLALDKNSDPHQTDLYQTNNTIPTYLLDKITTRYREKTNGRLKSSIQVHAADENNKIIVTLTAPLEGGSDSWELGELSFLDSTNNSYRFNILNDENTTALYELTFNCLENGEIAASLKDYSANDVTHYSSQK